MKRMKVLRAILYFCGWLETYSSNTLEKNKKRYAYLVLENVGNFQLGYKDGIVVLTL